MPTPAQQRAQSLTDLTAQPLDVLIIGGGIVGAGIARDAAMRNLRVGLVEQSDFASGTSSRSSRLLHGGLRYLAQGRILLVRQAGREKAILQRIAPHLAQPLPFIFPTYQGTYWPLSRLRLGVKLYDLLAGVRTGPRSDWLNIHEVREQLPLINPDHLTGAVAYGDGLTNDARLVLDTLRSADHHHAILLNYLRFIDAQRVNGLWRCQLHDNLADQSLDVQARSVVNAAGPWAARIPHAAVPLRLTKGVHLVIPRERLPIPAAVVMTDVRRILFAIPWHDRVILGTTDTDYAGPPEAVAVDAADIDYILQVTNGAFPSARLTRQDLISTWAGVRPLIASDRSGAPSDMSRNHLIRMPTPGWLDVAGGKLTTYRLMAEHAVDRLLRYLDIKAPRCSTADEPLVPSDPSPEVTGIAPPPIAEPIVCHYCTHEWAHHLDDIMIRRTSWQHYHREARSLVPQIAQWMAQSLAWSPSQFEAELSRCRTT